MLEFLPFKDVWNNYIFLDNDRIVGAIKVGSINLSLLFDKEQEIKQLENKVVDKLEGFDADAVYLLNYYLPNLSIQDKKRILIALKETNNDFYYLEEKIKVLQQRENINSIAGFLVKAIKDDYKLKGAC